MPRELSTVCNNCLSYALCILFQSSPKKVSIVLKLLSLLCFENYFEMLSRELLPKAKNVIVPVPMCHPLLDSKKKRVIHTIT